MMSLMARGILVLLLATTAQVQAQTAGSESEIEKIDRYVQSEMMKSHLPGVSVGVVRDGQVLLAKGYGVANAELSVPATESTVYQLASVTKTFTATAIMMLVEEGKLKLDDKVTKLLPDLPAAWEPVTLQHLLNHTSGIKSYTSVVGFEKTMRKDYTQKEILDLVAKFPLEFQPGERWDYSNTGYFLLGMIIEKVAGKPYGEFMDEKIFKPLGMAATRTNDLRAVIPWRAQGYTWNGKELRNGEYTSPTQPFSAGMLVSTVGDLIKWDEALRNDTLIKPAVKEQMWTSAKLNDGSAAGYGLGWGVSKVNGHRRISHGGGIPGFSTELCRFVDDKLTIIVLANSDSTSAGMIADGIAGKLISELAPKPQVPIDDPDPKLTDRLKETFLKTLKSELEPDQFSEESRKRLTPEVLKAVQVQAERWGALESFQLLERKANGKTMNLRYLAKFKDAKVEVGVRLDDEGKIAGLMLRPARD